MNRNRKLIIPKTEKRGIRNRHKQDLRRETVFSYRVTLAILLMIVIGIAVQMLVVGGVVK